MFRMKHQEGPEPQLSFSAVPVHLVLPGCAGRMGWAPHCSSRFKLSFRLGSGLPTMPGCLKPGLQGNCHIMLVCCVTHFSLMPSRSAGSQALLVPVCAGKEVRFTCLIAAQISPLHQPSHGKVVTYVSDDSGPLCQLASAAPGTRSWVTPSPMPKTTKGF